MAQVILFPGWQVFDANGNPAAGAKAFFYAAGTSTPVNVFSNSTLVTPHAVPVLANGEGRFPTIYAAAGSYKVKVTDSTGGLGLPGVDLFPEVDDWTILTDLTQAQISFPTVTKTADYIVLAADRGKVLEFDAAGATLIVTLKAATLGAGFPIWIVNSGATGTVQLEFDPTETLLDQTTYQLTQTHQSVGITSRGAAGWRLFTETRAFDSADAGATENPTFYLDRASPSPAAADILGAMGFKGRSSTGVRRVYARIRSSIKTVTNGLEHGLFSIRTILAGTEADRIHVGGGLYTEGVTGGDKGVGTINATTLYQAGVSLSLVYPPGHIFGLFMSNAAADTTNDITIAAGSARNDDDTESLVLAAPITKQIDGAWAVGSVVGGMNTGSVANDTWYEVHLIKRIDTNVVDVMFTTTANRATLPTNYTKKRQIGWVRRGTATNLQFLQNGDYFTLVTKVSDLSTSFSGATTANLQVLTVPPSTIARFRASIEGDGTVNNSIMFTDPTTGSESDQAAAALTDGRGSLSVEAVSGAQQSGHFDVRVNSSSQIRYRFQNTDSGHGVDLSTYGWLDNRGRHGP